jgi:hypothetical protein
MEAIERQNNPYYIKLRYMPPKGHLGIFVVAPSDECLVTVNLLSLDASLAIRTHVLRFEGSERRRRTPVRPEPSSGQIGQTHRSNRPDAAFLRSSTLALWINQGT